jgi:RNA-directed DNA polymerase
MMNLFMHYAFDEWMKRQHPRNPFSRYADGTPVQAWNKWGASPLTPVDHAGV